MLPHIKEAWDKYFATKDESAKAILVEHYQFLVKHIMKPFWHKKPFLLDHTDLISAGNIGLIQAIERYTNDRDTMFETFAQLRIRGAILDEINSLDWTPRSVRKNIRTVIKAEEQIAIAGDKTSPENISDVTGLSVEEVKTARNQATRTYILPVNQESIREFEGSLSESQIENGYHGVVGNDSHRKSLDAWISMMSELTDQEQRVILLRFYYEETMVRTAKILRTSPNNVSALQASAFEKIKASKALEPKSHEDSPW
ncbi:MAG: sigma-70 family RNA polymerase sigma factor [Enterococcus sp.]|nr:sigma-70 family RNA polymerase sigma factor [Enterococcus sp.]